MRYRMKPPEVDAEKWDGPGAIVDGVVWSDTADAYVVVTRNGPVALAPGDYVVTLPNGSKTVSAAASFERTFEASV